MSSQKRMHVAVAVIRESKNDRASILITKRADHVHQGGLWEFPGGKVESDETVQAALYRELEEELGIEVANESLEPLIQIRHDYPDKQVLLDVWLVNEFSGEAYGREGQPLKWVCASQLYEYAFPAANLPIIHAINLPRRYLITPQVPTLEALKECIQQAVEFGFTVIQIRQHQLDPATFLLWANELSEMFQPKSECRLIFNSDLSVLKQLPKNTAWHLNSASLKASDLHRDQLPDLVGVSCHNAEELEIAETLGVSYALLSPVNKTSSHPEQPGMGFERFRELVNGVSFPVYALGGLDESNMAEAVDCGAQGIAAISAWQAMMNPKKRRD
jgi:8-oxo-dGTP diphosphatase